jgi:outer membrane protein OmpA-like peptidoglycan-associated protein
MKTICLIAVIALVGSICSNEAAATVHKHAKKFRHAKFHSNYLPARDLANTKFKNVEFAFNKEEVPSEYYPELDHIAQLMTSNNASINVSGYADNKGGYVYNWKLSERRAKAVKMYLAGKGADTTRIAATEFGYTHPIASNKTPTGRKKNRRVEVKFVQ